VPVVSEASVKKKHPNYDGLLCGVDLGIMLP
jgi:hypothetical protein